MSGQRVGAVQLRELEHRVSRRDVRVLISLDEHRLLTTGQVARLHFADHRSRSAGIRAAVRVLTRLRELRLVTRLERSVGGHEAGSRAFVWALDEVGHRLLHRDDAEGRDRRRRSFDPSRTFLEHTLAVAEHRIELEEAARDGRLAIDRIETEPTCWRTYTNQYGQPAVLKPDLAAVTIAGDFEDHWFIEIDRDTESIRRILAKCAQYEAYRRTGREQAATDVYPLVVWVVPTTARRDRLLAEIAGDHNLDGALYRVVTEGAFTGLITDTAPPNDGPATAQPTDLTKGGTP